MGFYCEYFASVLGDPFTAYPCQEAVIKSWTDHCSSGFYFRAGYFFLVGFQFLTGLSVNFSLSMATIKFSSIKSRMERKMYETGG